MEYQLAVNELLTNGEHELESIKNRIEEAKKLLKEKVPDQKKHENILLRINFTLDNEKSYLLWKRKLSKIQKKNKEISELHNMENDKEKLEKDYVSLKDKFSRSEKMFDIAKLNRDRFAKQLEEEIKRHTELNKESLEYYDLIITKTKFLNNFERKGDDFKKLYMIWLKDHYDKQEQKNIIDKQSKEEERRRMNKKSDCSIS